MDTWHPTSLGTSTVATELWSSVHHLAPSKSLKECMNEVQVMCHAQDSKDRSLELFQRALEVLPNHCVRIVTERHGPLPPTLSTVRTFLNSIKCTVICGEARSDLAQRKHGSLPALGAPQHIFLLGYIYKAFISTIERGEKKDNNQEKRKVLQDNIQAIYSFVSSLGSEYERVLLSSAL